MNQIHHRFSIFSSAYQTLGNILKNIHNSSEAIKDPELQSKIERALLLYKQLYKDLEPIIQEQHSLRKELSELTRDPGEIVCGINYSESETMKNSFSLYEQYQQMKNKGANPQEVYWTAKANGINDTINLITLLRKVFDFSLKEAQEVIALAKGASQPQ